MFTAVLFIIAPNWKDLKAWSSRTATQDALIPWYTTMELGQWETLIQGGSTHAVWETPRCHWL